MNDKQEEAIQALKNKKKALEEAEKKLEKLKVEKWEKFLDEEITKHLTFDPNLIDYAQRKRVFESNLNDALEPFIKEIEILKAEIKELQKTPFEKALDILNTDIKKYKLDILNERKHIPAPPRKKQVKMIEKAMLPSEKIKIAKNRFLSKLIDIQFKVIEHAKYLKEKAAENKYPFSSQLGQAIDNYLANIADNEQKYWLGVLRELMVYVKKGSLSVERKAQVAELIPLMRDILTVSDKDKLSELLCNCVRLSSKIAMEKSEVESRLDKILKGVIKAKTEDNTDKKNVLEFLNEVNNDSKGKGTLTERGKKRAEQVESIRAAVDIYLKDGNKEALLLALSDSLAKIEKYAGMKTDEKGNRVYDSNLWSIVNNYINKFEHKTQAEPNSFFGKPKANPAFTQHQANLSSHLPVQCQRQ